MRLAARISYLSMMTLLTASCGGGSGGSTNSSVSTNHSSSSVSSNIDSGLPIKTAAETFFDMFGVYPGVYEVVFERDGVRFITQGRILANESRVGPYWGFLPDIEFCNWGLLGDSEGDHELMQYGYQYSNMQIPDSDIGFQSRIDSGLWDVALAADPLNTDIVRGTRHNRKSEKTETITMYRVADGKNYDGGFVSLTTSIEGLEVIESSSVCWGVELLPVFDENREIAFYREKYYINAFPHRGEELVLSDRNVRLIGITIQEISELKDGNDSRFGSDIFGPITGFPSILDSKNINHEIDEHGEVRRADDTFKIGVDAFRLDMVGAPGTPAEGFFIQGTVSLKIQPSYNK